MDDGGGQGVEGVDGAGERTVGGERVVTDIAAEVVAHLYY